MMNRKLFVVGLALFTLTAPLLVGCGDDELTSEQKLRLELFRPPATFPDPFESVHYLRVIATGDAFERRDTFMEFARRGGELPSIPYSSNVRVTVEGLTQECLPLPGQDPTLCEREGACDLVDGPCQLAPGTLVSRGRTGVFHLTPSSPRQMVTVLMLRVESYSPTSNRGRQATQMAAGRVGHSLTKLSDGRVLIAGGATLKDSVIDLSSPEAIEALSRSAEIFDPVTGDFNALGADGLPMLMTIPRAFHQAVLLPGNRPEADRVLIFGGYSIVNDALQPVSSVEIFELRDRSFQGDAPAMQMPRAYHTATPMPRGDAVLLVGGRGQGADASWELWNPRQGPTRGGGLSAARYNHTATHIPASAIGLDLVFLLGGENEFGVNDTFEVFNAGEQILYGVNHAMLTPTNDAPERRQARTLHTATWVPDQQILYVIGGYADLAKANPVAQMSALDIGCTRNLGGDQSLVDCWRRNVPFQLAFPRGGHTTTAMPGNALLIAGGCGDMGELDCDLRRSEVLFQADRVIEKEDGTREIQREVRLNFTRGELLWPHALHQALLLDSLQVLLVGGVEKAGGTVTALPNAEIFNPL